MNLEEAKSFLEENEVRYLLAQLKRLGPQWGAHRLRNYFHTPNTELTTLARACGKSNVHHLEKEDLAALAIEAAAMSKAPLAGTAWIPGVSKF